MNNQVKNIIPYALGLVIFGYLYHLTTQFPFDADSSRLGPDAWPKGVLYLALATCVYAIVRNAVFADKNQRLEDVIVSITKASAVKEESAVPQEDESYPHLLWIGIALTIGYAALLQTLGFFLCTFLYMVCFIYVGRYRNWWVNVANSLTGTVVLIFIFMKIVYVSLPIGTEPFSYVMLLIMRLMGIK